MESKHTPGPWGFASDGSIRSNHTPTNNYQSEYICSLLHYRDDRQDEKVANGHVLVAAPDLLAALEEMLAEYEGYSDGWEDDSAAHAICASAKAAIAKAKGEA